MVYTKSNYENYDQNGQKKQYPYDDCSDHFYQ